MCLTRGTARLHIKLLLMIIILWLVERFVYDFVPKIVIIFLMVEHFANTEILCHTKH